MARRKYTRYMGTSESDVAFLIKNFEHAIFLNGGENLERTAVDVIAASELLPGPPKVQSPMMKQKLGLTLLGLCNFLIRSRQTEVRLDEGTSLLRCYHEIILGLR